MDGDPGHNADGALGSDEQLLKVVARVVLPEHKQIVHDGAVGEGSLNAENVAVQAAVPEETQATRIGGDVSSDLTGPLGAQVEGKDVAAFGQIVVHRLQDAAGIHDE